MTRLLPLLAVLGVAALSACGGTTGTPPAATPASAPPQPVQVSIQSADFVALASGAGCANVRNRMFIIDQQQVFWDKAGTCSDARTVQALYGATPQTLLCSTADSIAGPRTSCNDETARQRFVTISQNLDKADLGLGAGHRVEPIVIPPGPATTLAFEPLYAPFHYGAPPANIVIRSADAWSAFWAGAKTAPQFAPMPAIDFARQMVLGVFFKTPNNCSIVQIVKLSSNGQALSVEYTSEERISIASCDANSALASTPMNLIVVDRNDLPVRFVDVSANGVAATAITLNTTANHAGSAFQGVIKDSAAWNAYFADVGGVGAPPPVDFSKRMVVVDRISESGCSHFAGVRLWRSAGKLNVGNLRTVDVSFAVCTQAISVSAMLLEVDRTDDPVEFLSIPIAIISSRV
jgi:hypothetical protein